MCVKIYIVGLISGLLFAQSTCEKDTDTCIFHYWRVDWNNAIRICEKNNKELLCYKSKKEVDDLIEAFKLGGYAYPETKLWLSNRNCSKHYELESCLSLHVEKKSAKSTWHYFQTDCYQRFQFVCCIKNGESSTSHLQSTSEWGTSISNDHSTSVETSVESSSTYAPRCKGIKRRGLMWPDTNLSEVVILPCPGRATGEAMWTCGEAGEWDNSGPDMKKCRSLEIKSIKDTFNTSSVSDTMSFISSIFGDYKKEIFSEDLIDVISIMKFLPSRLAVEFDIGSHLNNWISAVDIVEKATLVVDRIIELQSTWTDISQKRRPSIGTDLLSTVDEFALYMADSMKDNIEEQSVVRKNIALQVIRSKYGESLMLPQWTITSDLSSRGNIILDQGYDKGLDPNRGNISVVFTLYSNMSHILESPQMQKNCLARSSLNSPVLSATVTQARKPAPISSEVRILVEHLTPNPNQTACVFWNMDKNLWDTDGCRLEESNDTYSSCVCNHLTNFAVLMDYKGLLDDVDQRPFFYITVIGCSLSIICLAICVLVFSCYSYHSKHAWGLRYIIHRNLCLTLLIANLVLVLGLDQTDNERLCTVVAGMLHYFFLSAFSWMLLEGVHIYMLLVVVFASRRSHWEKYYLFGYGFPLIIVAITAISRPSYYGTDELCWLSIEKGTIWAFMGPVACILVVNTAALLLAQYKASNITVKDDNTALVKRWLRITFILFPVLGITWLFGFMYVGKRFVVVGYIFAILNSLQGFCIFVCHCLMDKKARNMVIASIKKKSSLVHTGSSAMQKKPNGTREAAKVPNLEQNGLSNKINDLNEPQIISFRDKWKKWHRWHMPWSFCFDLPVTEYESNVCQKQNEEIPKPIILQWNNLQDKTS